MLRVTLALRFSARTSRRGRGAPLSGSASCGRQAAGGRGALDGPGVRAPPWNRNRKGARPPVLGLRPGPEGIREASAEVRTAPQSTAAAAGAGGAGRAEAARSRGDARGLRARGRGWGLLASRPGRLLPPEGLPDRSPGSRTRLAGPPRRLPSPVPFCPSCGSGAGVSGPGSRWLGRGVEVGRGLPCASVGGPGSEGPAGPAAAALGWAAERGRLAEVGFGALYPRGLAGAPVGPRSEATCPQIPFPQCPALCPAVPRPRPLSAFGDWNLFWKR